MLIFTSMKKLNFLTFLIFLVFTLTAQGQSISGGTAQIQGANMPLPDCFCSGQKDSVDMKLCYFWKNNKSDSGLIVAYSALEQKRKKGDSLQQETLRVKIGLFYQSLIEAAVKRYDYLHAYQLQIRHANNEDSAIRERSQMQYLGLRNTSDSVKKKLQEQYVGIQNKMSGLEHALAMQEDRESRNLMISLSVSALLVIALFFLFPGYLLGKSLSKAHALKPKPADLRNETDRGQALHPGPESITKKEDQADLIKQALQRNLDGTSEQSLPAKTKEEIPAVIEKKKAEPSDSLLAARKIQQSLFVNDVLLKNTLPDSFILDKPSEVVSGDFCWTLVPGTGPFYLCMADCKGHGVPGAFRSVLFASFLNEALGDLKLSSADAVFEHVHQKIIQYLNPGHSLALPKEGMDAVLCMFDLKGGWLRFSCANNPLWLIRNGELKEFDADSPTVGRWTEQEKPFKLQTLGLRKGDCIYLFSNGFAKQTNVSGEKFGNQRMKDLLMTNCALPMASQQDLLNQTISVWQGQTEQVDDIFVIGLRV
jgi:serine phosphatase RsbU (regulator of sigma subunit)